MSLPSQELLDALEEHARALEEIAARLNHSEAMLDALDQRVRHLGLIQGGRK